ncbi:hypothetical protein [Merismopedia glauca]|uniref:hypothetical protein n=1 Tax=Merismopedia glauca TaxID=292586 RepID=UPI0011B247C9|nr:hypothetical protein [Merismopedia glauca]
MKIKRSFRIELSDRTHVNRNGRDISFIEDGEVLTMEFHPSSLDALSELIDKLKQIRRETRDRESKRLQKHSDSAQLPSLPSRYLELS